MNQMSQKPKLLIALYGNLENNAGNIVKDRPFIDALNDYFDLIDTYDFSLKGTERLVNAIVNFRLNRNMWREQFYKNNYAFVQRSKKFKNYFIKSGVQLDFILQIGVLFNAGLYVPEIPLFIYSDYTSKLSAEKPLAGRSPFSSKQYEQWFKLEQKTYHRASLIFTRSENTRQSIIYSYQISPDKIFVVGAGVNPDMLVKDFAFQKTNNLDEPVVLSIGKDFYRKGGDILLKSFSQLKTKFPSLKLNLITNGPVPDSLIIDGVKITSPTWDRAKIRELYNEATIFVLPSRLETWGDVLLEAMAFGLPCVGVSGDAMPEIIQDQETGYVVPPEEPIALARAIEKLLLNPKMAQDMGLKGQTLIQSKFTWENIASEIVSIIEKYI